MNFVYTPTPKMDFKMFIENEDEEKFDGKPADIPLSDNVHTLDGLFGQFGEKLYVVGGAVRDFYNREVHDPEGEYAPKDFDIATQANPDRVQEILKSPQAQEMGIKSLPKGEAFGVISAMLKGEEMEIATFREEWYDPEAGDGRRPDKVSFSTPGKDAQRRDLYYNALFYDIQDKEIRDYNIDEDGKGQGFKDIEERTTRVVGNPRDRFREDKLRVARLVRFFSRFNPGEIKSHLTPDVLDAIEEFKHMSGVSSERTAAEFISGLKTALSPINYLKNWHMLDLFPSLFPGIQINMDNIERVDNKNLHAVMAWIFRDNDPKKLRNQLNALSYSNDVSDSVANLLNHIQQGEEGHEFAHGNVAQLLKRRDIHKQLSDDPVIEPDGKAGPSLRAKAGDEIHRNIRSFGRMTRTSDDMEHFLGYQPTVKSQDYMHLPGAERGPAMKAAEIEAYKKSRANSQYGRFFRGGGK
jgi:tRNA nucleotidyltransferase/poly(A) polymerase